MKQRHLLRQRLAQALDCHLHHIVPSGHQRRKTETLNILASCLSVSQVTTGHCCCPAHLQAGPSEWHQDRDCLMPVLCPRTQSWEQLRTQTLSWRLPVGMPRSRSFHTIWLGYETRSSRVLSLSQYSGLSQAVMCPLVGEMSFSGCPYEAPMPLCALSCLLEV